MQYTKSLGLKFEMFIWLNAGVISRFYWNDTQNYGVWNDTKTPQLYM